MNNENALERSALLQAGRVGHEIIDNAECSILVPYTQHFGMIDKYAKLTEKYSDLVDKYIELKESIDRGE